MNVNSRSAQKFVCVFFSWGYLWRQASGRLASDWMHLGAGQIQGEGSIVFSVRIKLEPLLLVHLTH